MPIYHGVPLGSAPGPLLFPLYINDFHTAIKFCKVCYLDDKANLLSAYK